MKIMPINNNMNFKSKLPPASSTTDGWDELQTMCETVEEKQLLEESLKNLAFNGDENILALEHLKGKHYDYYSFRLYKDIESLENDRQLRMIDPIYDTNNQVLLTFSTLRNEYTKHLGNSTMPAKKGRYQSYVDILLQTFKNIVTKGTVENGALFKNLVQKYNVEDTISRLRIKG